MQSKSFSLRLSHKIKPFKKSIKVESDKSISIRSFLIGSISQDISFARNILESEDIISTINCLKKLGVQIKRDKPQSYKIYGKGLGSLFIKKNLTLNMIIYIRCVGHNIKFENFIFIIYVLGSMISINWVNLYPEYNGY